MLSALLMSSEGVNAPALAEDLVNAGIRVLHGHDCTNLAQDALKHAPDVVVLYQEGADAALFAAAESVGALAPTPIVVFTLDPDAANIARAMQVGIHAYVVDGYNPKRLRSVIHLAQARFRHDNRLREELARANQRFEERKLIDRAKGILMGARQLREEEAYRVLRQVAMDTKLRIGQVSQRVIDSAHYAEAVNRAGQLRMLSQRVVKLYALTLANARPSETKGLLTASIAHMEETFAMLARGLSKPTFGDLIDSVVAQWTTLKNLLDRPASPGRLREIDQVAEDVLLCSEQLTTNLEVSIFATALHVINVAGRQRMLSQRLAKAGLLAALLDGEAAAKSSDVVAKTTSELIDGMNYLLDLPLRNVEITGELASAARGWEQLRDALRHCDTPAGRDAVAHLSETLLMRFDTLTNHYERAMQTLVGSSMYEGQPGAGRDPK